MILLAVVSNRPAVLILRESRIGGDDLCQDGVSGLARAASRLPVLNRTVDSTLLRQTSSCRDHVTWRFNTVVTSLHIRTCASNDGQLGMVLSKAYDAAPTFAD